MANKDNNKVEDRIKELIKVLNEASDAYYNKDTEIISNFEYDKLYDELVDLENKYDIHFDNSPTKNVGMEVATFLPKVKHEKQMLSLDKTKDREALRDWLADKEGMLSYKLDGLTIVLTYDDGKLISGVTRGNGEIGEDITNNCKVIKNLPAKINVKGHLVIRGEAIITYSDFNEINENIAEGEEKFKNPRNLCSGAIRNLDPKVTRDRNVRVIIFSLVDYDGTDNKKVNKTFENQMNFLDSLGFDTVIRKKVDKNNILDTIEWYAKDVVTEDFPSDGLVLIYNDIEYGKGLGTTSKFPRNAIAFKWQDEIAKTKLIDIEWSPSRTGLINPVAIFDPVDLEGTIVKRASLHNVSIVEELELGIGDTINVYKANMIIPQVESNDTKSGNLILPTKCPACNSTLKLKNNDGVKTLVCENIDCPIKHTKSFENFVSRNCMNIEGVSIATIETFIKSGFVKKFSDLYTIDKYKDKIVEMDGFGEKSYENIVNAINISKNVELYRFINSLGINGIGQANSKILSKHFDDDIDKLISADLDELTNIKDIGPVLAKAIYDYFRDEKNIKEIKELRKHISLTKNKKGEEKLKDLVFVITGSLNTYENRDELVKVIEDNGGKVSSSVSKNTNYLINNDINSNSSKNKKAKELNVKIINEEMFKEMI